MEKKTNNLHMSGLGFCVWLVSTKGHAWQRIVREIQEKLHLRGACRPHVCVHSRMASPMAIGELSTEKTTATICGSLFTCTTNRIPGWPPLHTIELPVRLDPDNEKDDMHLSLAHRFGIQPFSEEEVAIVRGVLDDYGEEWKTCADMHAVIANVTRPDVTRWRDISP